MINHVGVDIHKRYSVLVTVDEQGWELARRRISGNSAADFVQCLARLGARAKWWWKRAGIRNGFTICSKRLTVASSPVERRKRLRGFKWSSYRGYAGLSAGFAFVQETMILDELRVPKRAERLRYRRFVEEELLKEVENPFEAVQWQAVLGDESFVQKLRDRIKGLHKHQREITSLRKVMSAIDLEKVLDKVARKYRVDQKRLVAPRERGLYAKNVAMWMIWETGSKSLREIGELFELDYAAVAQRIHRTRSAHTGLARSNLIPEMLNV